MRCRGTAGACVLWQGQGRAGAQGNAVPEARRVVWVCFVCVAGEWGLQRPPAPLRPKKQDNRCRSAATTSPGCR